MNIALINSEYPSSSGIDHGGIATYVYTMANELCAVGHMVHLIIRKNTTTDLLDTKIHLHTFDFLAPRNFLSYFKHIAKDQLYWESGCSFGLYKKLMQIHQNDPIDIVELPEYNGLANKFPSKLPFKVITTFHTPTILLDKLNSIPLTHSRKKMYNYELISIKKSDAFRSPSRSMAKKANEIYGIPQNTITCISNPLTIDSIDATNKAISHNKSKINLVFSGRLEKRKGAEILLFTICDILNISPNIHFTFVGETKIGEVAEYRSLIELRISEEQRKRVFFVGPAAHDNLSTILNNSDIFIFPSIFENAPYALLEAMKFDIPIIASDTSGISEIITHGKNGLLFNPQKPSTLTTMIKQLVTNHHLAKQLTKNAKEYVLTIHSPRAVIDKTVAFYNKVLKS